MELTPELGALLDRVVAQTLAQAAPDLGDNWELSVTLVDDAAIREINREHRGVDQPTDVLSFSLLEGEELAAHAEEPVALGDLVISLERAREQAEAYGHSLAREVGFLTVHGLLHILGWDHDTRDREAAMMEKTTSILGALGLHR